MLLITSSFKVDHVDGGSVSREIDRWTVSRTRFIEAK